MWRNGYYIPPKLRLWVVPLSLCASSVTRTKTARKKWPREMLGAKSRFFPRDFVSRHARSERGTARSPAFNSGAILVCVSWLLLCRLVFVLAQCPVLHRVAPLVSLYLLLYLCDRWYIGWSLLFWNHKVWNCMPVVFVLPHFSLVHQWCW